MDERIARVVEETRAYYDGAADEIYRDIWGENLHIGYFEVEGEPLQAAMARSNARLMAGISPGPDDLVLDVGCGYGALARDLARTFGCKVVATNISERELERGRQLTAEAGLDDRVSFAWADFHALRFADGSFEYCCSQEAFLHASDKATVLREAARVLKPGGTLVFTDLLVRRGTPQADRERIYQRVKSPDMWDTQDYLDALREAGLSVRDHADWSRNVAPTYGWVLDALERRRAEFEDRIGAEVVDGTAAALAFWVEAAEAGRIGWEYFQALKPG